MKYLAIVSPPTIYHDEPKVIHKEMGTALNNYGMVGVVPAYYGPVLKCGGPSRLSL